jgi:hypothetical protein
VTHGNWYDGKEADMAEYGVSYGPAEWKAECLQGVGTIVNVGDPIKVTTDGKTVGVGRLKFKRLVKVPFDGGEAYACLYVGKVKVRTKAPFYEITLGDSSPLDYTGCLRPTFRKNAVIIAL